MFARPELGGRHTSTLRADASREHGPAARRGVDVGERYVKMGEGADDTASSRGCGRIRARRVSPVSHMSGECLRRE